MHIELSLALPGDMSDLLLKAKALDLDCEGMDLSEFTIARKGKEIIGFGRLKRYDVCLEASTIGVIKEEQGKGIGSMIVNELLKRSTEDLYLICVIPAFFERFGFAEVNVFPDVLLKKCEFCHSFGYKKGEVFVMKRSLR
jgi:N-acetylglutamate synthase-like GNAT family acetyltransferase